MATERHWRGHVQGSPEYRRVLLALACAGVATFAQLYSVQGALPLIARDFEISASLASLSLSAATTGLAVAVLPWARVSDRLGRLQAMRIAMVVAVVLALCVPLAPSFEALVVLRFLEGAALGGIPALAMTYLNEEVHALAAAVAAGVFIAGNTVGGLSGRLIATPIAQAWGWEAGMTAVAAMCALATAAFIAVAPPQRGFVTEPGGVPRMRIAPLLADRWVLALLAQAFLLMGGFVAVYNFLGFRLEQPPFLLTPAVSSLLFLAYLAGTASSRRAAIATQSHGRVRVLRVTTVVMIAGVGITLAPWLQVVVIGLIVLTAGFFGAHAVAAGWVGSRRPGAAQAASLYTIAYYGGSSLFGWLGGLAFAVAGWPGTASMVISLALLAVAVAAWGLRGHGGR